MPKHTAKGRVLKESKGPKATEYQQNGVVKPVAVTAALLILSGAAAGIQPAGVENVTLQLNFNASEVYRSGTQTTPGEHNPSSYPYLSSNEPEALVPYGDTEELTNIYMADGLVAYYPLDETTGNTANDITTTLPDNDGTHVNFDGDELGAPGNISTGYDFEGDDFVDAGGSQDFGFENTSVTYSAWVTIRDNPNTYRPLIALEGLSDSYPRINLGKFRSGAGSGRIYFQVVDSSNTGESAFSDQTGAQLPKNSWMHLVGTADASEQEVQLYINGELQDTANMPEYDISKHNNFALNIGRFTSGMYSNGQGSNNLIDDVRIYNRSLSQQEIERLYNYSRGQPGTEQISATISSGGFLVASTKGGTPSIESRREAVNSRSLLGRIDPSFGFNPSRTSPTTNIVYRSPYNLTGDSFSSASSGIVLRNTAGLGDNATVSVAPIG